MKAEIKKKPLIIGGAGRSGAGKTTFINIAVYLLRLIWGLKVYVHHLDNYYRDRSDVPLWLRPFLNFDRDEAFDRNALREDLQAIREGRRFKKRVYNFTTREAKRTKEEVNPADYDIIFVEGHLLFSLLTEEEVKNFFDLTVFVTVPEVICLSRRLMRDIMTRGRSPMSVIVQYMLTVRPGNKRYVDPSIVKAKLKIHNGGYDLVALLELLCEIKERLNLNHVNGIIQ